MLSECTLLSAAFLGPCFVFILAVTIVTKGRVTPAAIGAAFAACRFTFLCCAFEAVLTALLRIGNLHAVHGEAFIALLAYWLLSSLGLRLLCGSEERVYGMASMLRLPKLSSLAVRVRSLRPQLLFVTPCLMVSMIWASLHMQFVSLHTVEVVSHMQDNIDAAFTPFQPLVKMLGMKQHDVDAMVKSFMHKLPTYTQSSSLWGLAGQLLSSDHAATSLGMLIMLGAALVLPVLAVCLSSFAAWQALRQPSSAATEHTPLLMRALRLSGLYPYSTRKLAKSVSFLLQDFLALDLFVAGAGIAMRVLPSLVHIEIQARPGFYMLLAAAITSTLHLELCNAVLIACDDGPLACHAPDAQPPDEASVA
mmetsp:Transcript_29097/g.64340  ORF Transcript_29097/g.64340 Transcript_29097/m.64340 type:complete len:364 (+) Transcript_29097:410-1501(+)